MSQETPPTADWSRAQRVAFRVVVCYFGLYLIGSLLDVGTARHLVPAIWRTVATWLGAVLGVGAPGATGPGTGTDAFWSLAEQLFVLVVALGIAGVWSLLDRRRTEYRRFYTWFRIGLRYYVAVIMLIYGGFKVIKAQFPAPTLDQLVQPAGAMRPMGLLWLFMGYSTVYTLFAGLGETIGAILLFFRRTTTLGALIIIAVMSNVALMNYAYDVPVKGLSTNLVLAGVVLAAPDAQRLLDVLVFNRTAPPANLALGISTPWILAVRRVIKPLVIVGATGIPLAVAWVARPDGQRYGPLYGIYDAANASRWHRVVVGRNRTLSVYGAAGDTAVRFAAAIDTVQHVITLRRSPNARTTSQLRYSEAADGMLLLNGIVFGDTVDVSLRRIDHAAIYPLARGFRWITP